MVIETRGEFTRGMTVCDHTGHSGRTRNVTVVLAISRERFLELLHRRLRD